MKEVIAWIVFGFVVIGLGLILVELKVAGFSTLFISMIFCIINGLPFFTKLEAEGGDHR